MFAFTKDNGVIKYLEELRPGTYTFYGSPPIAAGNVSGTCMCMGTVSFVVRAGVVTDLTPLANTPTVAIRTGITLRFATKEQDASRSYLATYKAPADIRSIPVVPAALVAHGKINNFYGGIVMRLAPIPGVLDYRRDTVIDAATGTALPNPAIVSRQKIKP